jgi:branched-chain amino acid transport system substrate-binding protein
MGFLHKRLAAVVVAVTVVVTGLTACSGSALTRSNSPNATSEIAIGLIIPKSGSYKAIGDDQLRGWQLYLDQHGGMLGGRRIKVITVDEGDAAAMTRAAIDKLLKDDKVSTVIGTADANAVSTLAEPVTSAKVPFVGTGGRPSNLGDVRYIWHTTFRSNDYGRLAGKRLASEVNGPVYVIGPDSLGGKDQIGGFIDSFTAAGGKLANLGGAWTPWPATDNFSPWLAKVRDSGAAAVYAFYAGAPAVAFVKQYKEFGLTGVPLYGAFLTEGAALTAEGASAQGVWTTCNYTPEIDHPANRTFVAAYTAKFGGLPSVYSVTMYDGAVVLDRAISAAGADPTPEAINTAIGRLGEFDSPRGTWTFSAATHVPVQHWYLRQVRQVDGVLRNVLVADLGVL